MSSPQAIICQDPFNICGNTDNSLCRQVEANNSLFSFRSSKLYYCFPLKRAVFFSLMSLAFLVMTLNNSLCAHRVTKTENLSSHHSVEQNVKNGCQTCMAASSVCWMAWGNRSKMSTMLKLLAFTECTMSAIRLDKGFWKLTMNSGEEREKV